LIISFLFFAFAFAQDVSIGYARCIKGELTHTLKTQVPAVPLDPLTAITQKQVYASKQQKYAASSHTCRLRGSCSVQPDKDCFLFIFRKKNQCHCDHHALLVMRLISSIQRFPYPLFTNAPSGLCRLFIFAGIA